MDRHESSKQIIEEVIDPYFYIVIGKLILLKKCNPIKFECKNDRQTNCLTILSKSDFPAHFDSTDKGLDLKISFLKL